MWLIIIILELEKDIRYRLEAMTEMHKIYREIIENTNCDASPRDSPIWKEFQLNYHLDMEVCMYVN